MGASAEGFFNIYWYADSLSFTTLHVKSTFDFHTILRDKFIRNY